MPLVNSIVRLQKERTMLGYVALIFIIYLSVKLSLQLMKHKDAFSSHEVPSAKIILLQLSSLLYIASLVGVALPIQALELLRPIPVGFLILLPGIMLGYSISSHMQRVGRDYAISAGRSANNIMWLGIATGIFMAANIGIGMILENATELH